VPRGLATLCLCLAASAPLAGGCRSGAATGLGGGPVVRQERISGEANALGKVAVIPFYPAETLEAAPAQGGGGEPVPKARWEIAALVSNQVSEALVTEGVPVVAPSDVELAFVGEGHPVPRLDPLAAARLAGGSFGATSVLLGKVVRYREREGGAAGSIRPASVAFEVSLHHVPSGRRLWTGRFDETQQSLTANVFRARQYPGGGTRWLSASEFAHWGAAEVVRSLVAEQRS